MRCVTRLFAVVLKELRQLGRDRVTFAMIAGIPLMQVILFGYAINTDVRHLSAGVADQAGTELSRQLVADAQASQVIDITRSAATTEELLTMLRRGDIMVGIAIPPDFERRLQQPDRAAALLLVDGADPVVLGAARQLAQMTMHEDTTIVPQAPGPLFEVYNPYNPERRSAVHIVPGLIGVILTMTMAMFTAVAIVRERERGNMEMLITTPVRNIELMVGKILPYIGIGLIQVTLILLLGHFLFRVPIRGSIGDVYLASLAFIAANLGLGLVISTVAQNQFQAMQMTFFVFSAVRCCCLVSCSPLTACQQLRNTSLRFYP